MDDITILDALKRDEEEGYALLIERYTPYVTAIIAGIAKGALSTADVEELAADVFFKVWLKRADIRAETMKAFIAQIARHASIDRLRKLGETPVPFDDDVLQLSHPLAVETQVIQQEQCQILQTAVDGFDGAERQIFVRFYFYGEPVAAIAGDLDMNTSTIKTKLHRLRKRLKGILQERGYGCE